MTDPFVSWGFYFRFLFSGHDSGHGAFVWFPSDRLAIEFLFEKAPFLLPGNRASQMERHYAAAGVARDWLYPHPGYVIGPASLARGMTQAFQGVMAVNWFGSFFNLCRGDSEFERTIRLGYFRSADKAVGPILSSGDMLEFLRYSSQEGAKHW